MAFPTTGSLRPVLHVEEAILEFSGTKVLRKVLYIEIHRYNSTLIIYFVIHSVQNNPQWDGFQWIYKPPFGWINFFPSIHLREIEWGTF
jgi:hypothetical protein